MDDNNRFIIDAWDTVLNWKFCGFRHLLVDGLSQHSDAAFGRCYLTEGSRVRDMGCGFGDSTLHIARRVGRDGEAIGIDRDDAVEFAMALGPAGEIIRLAGDAGAHKMPLVITALRETLAPYVRSDGIWAPSSTWRVTASSPPGES